MTASSPFRQAAGHPLRMIEAGLLGALFLGVIAMVSLPVAGWAWPWLAAGPGAGLATACALRLSGRKQAAGGPARVIVRHRRSAMAVATCRRAAPTRRGSRLLAALVLR